jgi:predicted GNAT superfamily acetyltransferase
MKYSIRNATSADLVTVLALNESVVPHVNSLDMTDMQDFLTKAAYFRVVCDEEKQVLAFLIGLAPDTEYDSLNFQWFCNHYENFAYVDRIAVATSARRQGIAEALYEDFTAVSLGWAQRLGCEVNLRPDNPGSLAFHHRLGFTQVGTQETHNGAKKVAFLLKEFHSQ